VRRTSPEHAVSEVLLVRDSDSALHPVAQETTLAEGLGISSISAPRQGHPVRRRFSRESWNAALRDEATELVHQLAWGPER
jgi:hypothetical protein